MYDVYWVEIQWCTLEGPLEFAEILQRLLLRMAIVENNIQRLVAADVRCSLFELCKNFPLL